MTVEEVLANIGSDKVIKIFENHVSFSTKDIEKARTSVYVITKNLHIIFEEAENIEYLINPENLTLIGLHPLTLLEMVYFFMNCIAVYQPKIKIDDFYEIALQTLPIYGYDVDDVRRTNNLIRKYLQEQ